MSFLITILALGIVIFIHECGHLIAAKRSGIGASLFAIGFGPVLIGKQWGDTHYSLRLLPFGGFVKLDGLDDDPDQADSPTSFYHASLPKRFLTISAGSLANLALGFVLFFVVFLAVGSVTPLPTIHHVLEGSPAHQAGLRVGDTITHVNQHPLEDVRTDIIETVAEGSPMTLAIQRNAERLTFTITPTMLTNQESPKLGIGFDVHREPGSLFTAVPAAFSATWMSIKEVFIGIHYLITGKVSVQDMAGPVGIVQFASFGLKNSLLSFLSIMAKISISLGVINLFPFPMLDGGHNVLLAIEAIRKKRLSKKVEFIIQQAGAFCLILLMVFIVTNDILSWGTRHSFLQSLIK